MESRNNLNFVFSLKISVILSIVPPYTGDAHNFYVIFVLVLPYYNVYGARTQGLNEVNIEHYEDKYQIVAAVHEDREHLHIHFGMNTTSYCDGSKYHGTKKDYYDFIRYMDDLTAPYGIHVKPEE